jgi:hypothetical protein
MRHFKYKVLEEYQLYYNDHYAIILNADKKAFYIIVANMQVPLLPGLDTPIFTVNNK